MLRLNMCMVLKNIRAYEVKLLMIEWDFNYCYFKCLPYPQLKISQKTLHISTNLITFNDWVDWYVIYIK